MVDGLAFIEGFLGLVLILMVGLRAGSVSCFLAADGGGVVAVEYAASIFLFAGLPVSSLVVAQGAVQNVHICHLSGLCRF